MRGAGLLILSVWVLGCGSTEPEESRLLPLGVYDYRFQVENFVFSGTMTLTFADPAAIDGLFDVEGSLIVGGVRLQRYAREFVTGSWQGSAYQVTATAELLSPIDGEVIARTTPTHRLWREGDAVRCTATYVPDGAGGAAPQPATCSVTLR